jgi:hypothetical protein
MPASSIRQLRQRTGPRAVDDTSPVFLPTRTDAVGPADPLGVDVQTRGLANARAAQQDLIDRSYTEQNPLLATSAITGPLPDPKWAGFFQSLRDAGVTKLRGGASPAGSTQLTGESLGTGWMPTAGLAPGVSPTGTAGDALGRVQTSMPGSLDALQAKTIGTKRKGTGG